MKTKSLIKLLMGMLVTIGAFQLSLSWAQAVRVTYKYSYNHPKYPLLPDEVKAVEYENEANVLGTVKLIVSVTALPAITDSISCDIL